MHIFACIIGLNRIAELEKSLIDGNSKAINHQKQLEHKHQIEYAPWYAVHASHHKYVYV